MIWIAYLVVVVVIAIAIGDRLRARRKAQERLAEYKKRALGL